VSKYCRLNSNLSEADSDLNGNFQIDLMKTRIHASDNYQDLYFKDFFPLVNPIYETYFTELFKQFHNLFGDTISQKVFIKL
jgi:hypothetical protein